MRKRIAFYCMTNGMSEIQYFSQSFFLRIGFYNFIFDFNRSINQQRIYLL